MSNVAPEVPGVYLVFFPESTRYDVVSLIWQQSALNRKEFYLMAANRGGCIYNWRCLWSEQLPHTYIPPEFPELNENE